MTLNQIQKQVEEIFFTQDSSDAIKLIKSLKSEATLDESLQNLMVQLQFIRIASLTPDQLYKLLEEDMLIAYTIPEYFLSEKIEWYLDQTESLIDQVEIAKKLKRVIQDNEAIFSDGNIKVKGQSLPGSIKNWIADYDTYPTPSNGMKGALNEVEYLNKSSNVKLLDETQKNVLRDILNLYDDLISMIAKWDAVPVPSTEEEATKDFDLYRYIPGIRDDLDEDEQLLKAVTQSKSSALPDRLPRPIQDIQPPRPPVLQQPVPRQPAPVQSAPTSPTPPINPPRIRGQYNQSNPQGGSLTGADAAKIHNLINSAAQQTKRGITKDPTNVVMEDEKQRMTQEREIKEKEIQKKLADLRSRNKNK